MSTLSERLQALGVQIGAKNLQRSQTTKTFYPLNAVLNVSTHTTIFGQAQYIHKTYPADYQHGTVNFSIPLFWQILASWGQITHPNTISRQSILFLDTETTGLSGGSGTLTFLIGLGYWKDTEFELIQYFLPSPEAELSFLTAFDEFVSNFNCLVTFNGKSFDIPLINARHTLNRLQSPFNETDHLDLLHLSRRIWRYRLTDRSLTSLEENILRLSRTQQDIPGWMIPQMYLDYLHTLDARPLASIFYHNEMDILSLAALFLYLGDLLEHPLQQNQPPPGLDWMAIAHLYEDIGHLGKAIELYRATLKAELPPSFYIDTCRRFARIYRQQQDWPNAIALWQTAAETGDALSCIELAKYYEHQMRDYNQAIAWTNQAIQQTKCPNPEHIQRLHRLEKKVSRQTKE
jgi:uncharacterized protein YprB with RNaseH-like and TPR domain